MTLVAQILIGLFGLSVMVLIHEWGHYVAARWMHIEVRVFSVGFGPKIVAWQRQGVEFRLSWIPLGGYVRMKGEEDMVSAITEKKDHVEASPGSFFAARPWRRIVVAVAGPLTNLLFAVLVLTILNLFANQRLDHAPRLKLLSNYQAALDKAVPPDQRDPLSSSAKDDFTTLLASQASPANLAGLQDQDLVTAVNGQPITSWHEFFLGIGSRAGERVLLDVSRRGGDHVQLSVTPALNTQTGAGTIGVLNSFGPLNVTDLDEADKNSGWLVGDTIIEVAGINTATNLDLDLALAKVAAQVRLWRDKGIRKLGILTNHQAALVTVKIKRNGLTKTLNLAAHLNDGHLFSARLQGGLAVVPYPDGPYPLIPALGKAIGTTGDIFGLTLKALGQLFHGLNPFNAFSGPGRTVTLIGQQVTDSLEAGPLVALRNFLNILALISVALCFGNLLPIPALDGGQIVLFVWEAIIRRPLKVKTIQRYQIVGLVMVLGLTFFAITGDFMFFAH